MKCFKPLFIDTNDYEIYGHGKIAIPCGKCEACRNSDAMSWRIRLLEEFYNSDCTYFITLTYNDNELPFEQCFDGEMFYGWHAVPNKSDVQKFFKRFRKKYKDYYKENGKSLSYFLVSEYGPNTFRPHYHLLLFNFPILSTIPEKQKIKATQEIEKLWSKGFITLDTCNENRVAYCTKYMSCQTVLPSYLPKPFRLMSKGLGISYLNKEKRIAWHKEQLACYYPYKEFKYRLPRYLKDKIFSDDEKQMLKELFGLWYKEDASKQRLLRNNSAYLTSLVKQQANYKQRYKKKAKKRKDI